MIFGLLLRRDQGFSFIEVLVSISIMALIVTVGLSNFRGFQRRKATDAVANQIRSDLRLAQEFAISSKKDCTLAADTYVGNKFIINDATHYSILSICNDGSADYTLPVPEKTNVEIVNSANHTISTVGASIDFMVLARSPNNALTVTITNTSTGDTQTAAVSTSGEIN